MSCLLGDSMVGLMMTSSRRAYATCFTTQVCYTQSPLPLQQTTADLYLHRRHSNTQRQVWLRLCGISGSWCTQGFVWALWASLAGMGCDCKHYFSTPNILLGLLLLGHRVFFFFLVGSNIVLSMVVQKQVVILQFLWKRMSTCPSTLPSWVSTFKTFLN